MSKKNKPVPRPGETPRLDSVYRGVPDGPVTADDVPLDPRLDLANHSPDGFSWGYGGSGPAQLSLALLADVLGDDQEALRAYQSFKFEVVAKLPSESPWELIGRQIRDSNAVMTGVVREVLES